MALELIRDLSAKSWVSQRLWRTVGSLKAYAPRLGLQDPSSSGGSYPSPAGNAPRQQQQQQQQQQQPLHPPVGTSYMPTAPHPQVQGGADVRNNGIRLQTEMRHMYEEFIGARQKSAPPRAS